MTRDLKPIKIYGGVLGPNPFKVCVILAELDLPFESEEVPFSEVKSPAYVAINPNGRLPSIYDPNTDITIWESGAIIEYLIDRYDQDHKLSFTPSTADSYHARQWLHFQATGQGPYYGQAIWFKKYHSERIPSAVERYVNEIKRVSKVLDDWLETREWLVGEKLSYADLAFIPWQNLARKNLVEEGFDEREYPHLSAWLERMSERVKVKDLLEKQEQAFKEFQAKQAAKE